MSQQSGLQQVQHSQATEVRYEFTPVLVDILQHLNSSLLVTTYQAGKLMSLGTFDGKLHIGFHTFERPMGLAVESERIALGTRREVHFLKANRDVAARIQPAGMWDSCLIPVSTTHTGSIHGHELAWGTNGLWIVNTLFSCLCQLHEDYSFVPRWKPPFITELADQDRCHLNGLAMDAGRPRFVTAMAESNTPAGWRPTKASSGVVIDVETGQTVCRGFAMPHSPRIHHGRLWVLDSGRGALCVADPVSGQTEIVTHFPGYVRGLSFAGQFAFVGLSKIRETSVFGGVPIAENRSELKCGIGVVDLVSGRTVAVFQFLSGVSEIFAVEVADNMRCPFLSSGTVTDQEHSSQEHDVWIVPSPGILPPLTASIPWYSRGPTTQPASGQPASGPDLPASGPGLQPNWPQAAANSPAHGAVTQSQQTAVMLVNRGNQLQEQQKPSEAIACYERAIEADLHCIPAWQNLGYILFNQGFAERARDVYSRLIELDPSPLNQLLAASVLPVTYDSIEDLHKWRQFQTENIRRMAEKRLEVDASRHLVPTAFFWPYQGMNDIHIMRDRGSIIRGKDFSTTAVQKIGSLADRRIRVGFISAYFRNHTIGRLNIGRICGLDRNRFHVTVLSTGKSPSTGQGADDYAVRFRETADTYVELPNELPSAAHLLQQQKLDLLIFTDVGMDALTSTLSHSRFAPVQCATWGHPETTGSSAIDFFLSSELLESPAGQTHYTERLLRMKSLGTYYENPKRLADQRLTRQSFQLPEASHWYACPQSLFKFHPDFDETIGEILRQDRNGILVLIEGRSPEWTRRLTTRLRRSVGDSFDRIHFLPQQSHSAYLRLLGLSDVVLDPFHFGGGNSSYESFAMGTPVVTLPGEFLRSRITTALCLRMNFTDLIAKDAKHFVALAVRLGTEPEYQQQIRRQIDEAAPILFDNPEDVVCFESALEEAVRTAINFP